MTKNEEHTWKLTLAWDGTGFHGWQVQPGHLTIQGTLAGAIERITGERVLPQGSGRTDTGVHARGQVASFTLAAPIPPANLHRALNRALPETIRILSAEHAPSGFHARHSACAKTYEYRIFRGEICPPWLSRFVYALNWPLQVDAMRQAAALVLGEHDFTSFAASDPDLATRNAEPAAAEESLHGKSAGVRVIYASSWHEERHEDGDLLLYRIRGNGFLHHMVRNLVGTFLDAGRGHIAPEEVRAILERRSRSAAGPTAPARGLFLDHVEYPPASSPEP
ncbi:tRNA pseudouridine(38-40) synthase TruA [Paracidobacterium acidisoli]|uniref:tRNA pseudouridine synthase A n=1 Tax=Paracidobacterium acidisoli TaxID=2303751 RepID=A0A372IS74_9BACT|nr:tRNA pseudouridine(38-40) synthase TruA [Paracidobacterium acidisoli]MBT9330744.1 tRNA pseudouridine(38-40) synthase TruA [Paracidobacterium acidisoli]